MPGDMIAETVRFSPEDVADSWSAHVRGPHRQAVADLTPDQLAALRTAYTEAVQQAMSDDDSFLDAEVIYAFGAAGLATDIVACRI
ncbi:hypothetical protein [Haloactinopolyspora alba]|uniref:hypothetical protein n=1 Tax=Haloactinopolyspora alba TaxID=648780 RepID=UPI00101D4A15|nr:hypothetical protein [Haloactinopolyspora alba]